MTDLAPYRRALAEVAGLEWHEEHYNFGVRQCYLKTNANWCDAADWRPDEDVAQAIRVLEAIQDKAPNGGYFCCMDIRRPICEGWEVALRLGSQDADHAKPSVLISMQDSLPRAICLAVIAALGLEASE